MYSFSPGKMTISDIPVKAVQTYKDSVLYVVEDPVGISNALVQTYFPKGPRPTSETRVE